MDVIWLTCASIPSDSDEEIDFWKVGRALSKNRNLSIRIVCGDHLSTGEFVGRWKDRLSASVVSFRTTADFQLSDLNIERVLCNHVQWRGFVGFLNGTSLDSDIVHPRIRSRLLNKKAEGRCRESIAAVASFAYGVQESVSYLHRFELASFIYTSRVSHQMLG